MIRTSLLGLTLLSLTACGKHYAPLKVEARPADVPDAALVQPCDRYNQDPVTNAGLVLALAHTRRQRDDCADRMEGVAKWRADALKRAQTP